MGSQNHGLSWQRYDCSGLVPGKRFSEKTYYYWQRRLFQALSEQQQATQQPAFVEITSTPNVRPSGGAAVTVRIVGAEADIYSGADAVTVETVLRILKSC